MGRRPRARPSAALICRQALVALQLLQKSRHVQLSRIDFNCLVESGNPFSNQVGQLFKPFYVTGLQIGVEPLAQVPGADRTHRQHAQANRSEQPERQRVDKANAHEGGRRCNCGGNEEGSANLLHSRGEQ